MGRPAGARWDYFDLCGLRQHVTAQPAPVCEASTRPLTSTVWEPQTMGRVSLLENTASEILSTHCSLNNQQPSMSEIDNSEANKTGVYN